jgi:hypothetical protein
MFVFQNNFYRAAVSLAEGFLPQGSSIDADEKDQGGAGAIGGGVVADGACEVVGVGTPAMLGGGGSCCLSSCCATRQVTVSMQKTGTTIAIKYMQGFYTCRRIPETSDRLPAGAEADLKPPERPLGAPTSECTSMNA